MQGFHGVEINTSKITATGDIEVSSKNRVRVCATFEPIAIIEHSGVTTQGDTCGHYRCDVKARNGKWFSTDDKKMPKKIERRKVTKSAAVVLYCKKM